MTMKKFKVCFLSNVHKASDSRLIKEITSLSKLKDLEICILARYSDDIDQIGVKDFVKFYTFTSKKRLLTPEFWKLLHKVLVEEKPHVFHFHDPDLIPVGIILKILGKKVIYDVHENYKYVVLNHSQSFGYRLLADVWDFMERVFSAFFDSIIVVDSLIFKKFPKSKTIMVTNMPSISMFNVLEKKRNSLNNRVKFVHTGNLNKERGSKIILHALKLTKYLAKIEFHVIGAIDIENKFKCLGDVVRIYKRIPFHDLAKMYSSFDVGVLLYQPIPAHLFFTGEGNTKVFEYMAAGLPIIMSDLKLLRNTFEPIGCCIFVDPTNPKEVADAIDYLYENPDVRKEMGLRGRKAFLERFNWEEQEKRLLRAYKKVLNLP